MAVALIINPVSGGGSLQRQAGAIRDALGARFGDVEVMTTAAAGDARRFGRQAADGKAGLVIALGGDGTISEAADGILSSTNPQTPFAFIPAGTGSDFSRAFAGGPSLADKIAAISCPDTMAVDAGLVRLANGQGLHVVNIASFGISGIIAEAVNKAGRSGRVPGRLVFMLRSVAAILTFRPVRVRLAIDGGPAQESDVTLVALANGRIFGGGMKVAPDAALDDGLFDVVIVGAVGRLRLLALFPFIYLGLHTRFAAVTVTRARTLEAEILSGNGAIEVDGESGASLPARFEMKPAALSLAMRPRR